MRIKLTSIMVDDQEKAARFYTDTLGFATECERRGVHPATHARGARLTRRVCGHVRQSHSALSADQVERQLASEEALPQTLAQSLFG